MVSPAKMIVLNRTDFFTGAGLTASVPSSSSDGAGGEVGLLSRGSESNVNLARLTIVFPPSSEIIF